MAANYFSSGTTDKTITFNKAVSYLNIFVGSGVTFSFSLDTINYMTLPAGFHSFPVGLIKEVRVTSSGAWQLIGVQA